MNDSEVDWAKTVSKWWDRWGEAMLLVAVLLAAVSFPLVLLYVLMGG
jgi:hypothetical protein